jgi:serine/threonine-protein kinase
VDWGLIDEETLRRAVVHQQTRMPTERLGRVLWLYGLLTRQQVLDILAYQRAMDASTNRRPRPGGSDPSPPVPLQFPSPEELEQLEQDDPLLGQRLGHYTVLERITEGGMGIVYRAHHRGLARDYVVKVLNPELAHREKTVKRFLREARSAARLEHPHVVPVVDVGTGPNGQHYMVQKFVEGESLQEMIDREGRFSPRRAVELLVGVARALAFAHSQGIIHRDVKPDNILYDRRSQVAQITDFGLARDEGAMEKLTVDNQLIGTPLYLSPEVGRGPKIDGRVDVYSLGLTLYYFLTGVQPLKGFTPLEVLGAKAHQVIRFPLEHVPDLPLAHARVLGRMLAYDREDRFPDMAAVVRAFEDLLADRPVTPGPGLWRFAEGEPVATPRNVPAPSLPAPPAAQLNRALLVAFLGVLALAILLAGVVIVLVIRGWA